ncbi:MAG: DEAD/DEAH box helicase family protein [Kiritimatiellae bacterium]|nr:DEAD/DEAH box helicase family protein [Kiritimatiellia bacterium]
MNFTPGTIVAARGREWIVQTPDADTPETVLRLRPLTGTAADDFLLDTSLEPEVSPASFPPPDPEKAGTFSQALLLRDALRLSLRAGAGPLRSFGNLAFAPRAYQLVPLMMALREPVVRLLVADDVGVGKTIESGLILRELLDRGEIERASVLCPPPLVDQWVSELERHFHITAKAVTSASADRLQRDIPDQSLTIFQYYPFTVVSLDYIKSDAHAAVFRQTAPEFVIVDEAHTCTQMGSGRSQRRWKLVKSIAEDPSRHIVLATATPHSGNQLGFANLLSLLKPEFAAFADGEPHPELRQELAGHFVQRRRADLAEWRASGNFPSRKVSEVTYKLNGDWKQFFDHVLEYCRGILAGHSTDSYKDYIYWYAALGLLRCASSSPAAAVQSLQNRIDRIENQSLSENEMGDADETRVLDFEDSESSDISPDVDTLDDRLAALELIKEEAEKLAARSDDPKLVCLIRLLEHDLLKGGDAKRPIVFCRYIETAKYVAERLRKKFPGYTVTAVCGTDDADARQAAIDDLARSPKHILVATDCLAEGINLQRDYDAVVHYDLLWNPTRHQQREGRVDRFGQMSNEVKCALLYGQDNPVDGIVLKVISRKAQEISDSLGVSVPVPEDDRRVSLAIMKAGIFQSGSSAPQQLGLFDEIERREREALEALRGLEAKWQDAAEKEKANRTKFAQRILKPENVLPEWQKVETAFGSAEDVQAFTKGALAELGSHTLSSLPPQIVHRLQENGAELPEGLRYEDLTRSHPLVASLAGYVLESALDPVDEKPIATRSGAAVSREVERVTRIYLLRLRHRLDVRKRDLIVEETQAVAVTGVGSNAEWISDPAEVEKLLHFIPSSNLTGDAVRNAVRRAIDYAEANRPRFESFAAERAKTLLADHRRVRDASDDRGSFGVKPILPVDIMGVFVLLPEED